MLLDPGGTYTTGHRVSLSIQPVTLRLRGTREKSRTVPTELYAFEGATGGSSGEFD